MPRARVAFGGVGEMVHLVENEQREPRAPSLQQRKRGVIRGDRERTNFLLVAVVGAHAIDAEGIGELREPLGDERSRWRDDARARLQLVDGEQRDERLTGAGR